MKKVIVKIEVINGDDIITHRSEFEVDPYQLQVVLPNVDEFRGVFNRMWDKVYVLFRKEINEENKD